MKLLFVCRRWRREKEITLEDISSVSSQNDLKFESTVSDVCASSEGKSFCYLNVSSVSYRKTVYRI